MKRENKEKLKIYECGKIVESEMEKTNKKHIRREKLKT
jgi:NADH:ubiquinone oxidoreductase subunit 3 (subunit A)